MFWFMYSDLTRIVSILITLNFLSYPYSEYRLSPRDVVIYSASLLTTFTQLCHRPAEFMPHLTLYPFTILSLTSLPTLLWDVQFPFNLQAPPGLVTCNLFTLTSRIVFQLHYQMFLWLQQWAQDDHSIPLNKSVTLSHHPPESWLAHTSELSKNKV